MDALQDGFCKGGVAPALAHPHLEVEGDGCNLDTFVHNVGAATVGKLRLFAAARMVKCDQTSRVEDRRAR
ncbi:hypothetical protein HFN80_17110 [Rhizobium laguerreae]|nr:hypothetical protein [Rhizobium laguerreae]MBY3465708.1 hypothetical protein [Rhizobium laguerreae]